MLHTSLHHWFIIGLILHPLAGHSLGHCIENSRWLLNIGSHWIGTIIIRTTVVPKRQPFHTLNRTFIGLYNWSLVKINIKPCTQSRLQRFD